MRGAVRRGSWSAVVGAAVLAVASPAGAQDRPNGWIGISFDVSYDRRGRADQVVITEVLEASPAAGAGLRRGDRLVAVNDFDRPAELARLAERLRLQAGDEVRMVIERDGRRRELRLRAADRSRDFGASQSMQVRMGADSLVEAMVRAMDSVRLELIAGMPQGRVRVSAGSGDFDDGAWALVSGDRARTVQAPFEFFVFRGEQHDSLRREMVELNRSIEQLERRVETRTRELERRARRSSRPVRFAQDGELRRLRAQVEEATSQAQELETAMAEAARSRAGFEYTLFGRADAEPRGEPASEPYGTYSAGGRAPVEQYRPLTPYLLGRNRIAGAEVIDLRPELASYFGVEGGVLVVDVAPRTPAAISGLVPGDVITRLDQVTVRTVEDLRFGVSQAGETVPIALVRRGTSVQVLLRR